MAFLDVKKAFDTVWHDGLFHKLFNYGIKDHTWQLLCSWYHNPTCEVLWEGTISRHFLICQGVKQGAILSSFLYTIFINDLLHKPESDGLGVQINNLYWWSPYVCRRPGPYFHEP